jgi:hypothetical protein
MRRLRMLVISTLAAGSLLPTAAGAQIGPVASFHCTNTFGVVFPPARLTHVSENTHGVFGAVVGVPSNVSCTGDIVGTATITGDTYGCAPHSGNGCDPNLGTVPQLGPAYTTVNDSGVAALFSATHASAVLTPDPGTGLRWADDVGLAKGLVSCTIDAAIVGSPAGALLGDIAFSCEGANETTAHTFTGTTSLALTVLLGPAGNLITSSVPGYEELCPDPLVTLNPDDLQCFRSVLLYGAWNATDNGIF